MNQFKFAEGSSISIPATEPGAPIRVAFTVASIDTENRATTLVSTNELPLSAAMNFALKETGAVSAWADRDNTNVIHLSHGYRPDSPHYNEERDYSHAPG